MQNFSFHTVLGRYSIEEKTVNLDYGSLVFDVNRANATLAHETTHAVISGYEFGQATFSLLNLSKHFAHLEKSESEELVALMCRAQLFVQEGFASFMEVASMLRYVGKEETDQWMQSHMPNDYKERFDKLSFALNLSRKERDFFTIKIPILAMETGIRKVGCREGIFGSKVTLEKYLSLNSNNPNSRLEKILRVVRRHPSILRNSLSEIARKSGISYNKGSSKDEIANFINYLYSLTRDKTRIKADDVGNAPKGNQAIQDALDNLAVVNQNFSLSRDSEILTTLKDIIYYSDVCDTLFVLPRINTSQATVNRIERATGLKPEVGMLLFTASGEKYTFFVDEKSAKELLENEFSKATLMTRNGYDVSSGNWGLNTRSPDVICHVLAKHFSKNVEAYIASNLDESSFSYAHISATIDHPFQTLLVKFGEQSPLHILNAYGNKQISEILSLFKEYETKEFTSKELEGFSQYINSIFGVWMNLTWKVDWAKTMLKGDLFMRG